MKFYLILVVLLFSFIALSGQEVPKEEIGL